MEIGSMIKRRPGAGIAILLSTLLCISFSPGSLPAIFLAGDSTMSHKPDPENPERGWGMYLPEYFEESIRIENHAKNGRSTRSFIYEGRWDSLILRVNAGDYVVIQFGHNDGSPHKTERYAIPREYEYNLTRFVNDVLSKAAHPILCTPVARRKFDSLGHLVYTHGVYPDIVKKIANEKKIPLIDMEEKTRELILEFGKKGSKDLFLHYAPGELPSFPDGKVDNTHFSPKGARLVAGLFVEGLHENEHELTQYLKPNDYEK